ncbi:unnamed protein product, partial [marine sediment metagenome]
MGKKDKRPKRVNIKKERQRLIKEKKKLLPKQDLQVDKKATKKIDKSKNSNDLNQEELNFLFHAFKNLRNKLLFGEINAQIVFNEDEEEISVIPFELELFKNNKKKQVNSFNDAVDEYFSKIDSSNLITP